MESVPRRPSSSEWRHPASINSTIVTKEERGGELPSLNFSEAHKFKSESQVFDPKHNSTIAVLTTSSTPALASPQSAYSGPPPPYYPPATSSMSVTNLTGYASPPDSRRVSDDDKEPQPKSLPSIHEALGKDHGSIYSSAPSMGPHSAHVSHKSTSSLSPTTPVPRSHPEPNLAGPPNPYASMSQPLPPYSSEPVDRRSQSLNKQSSQGSQSEDGAFNSQRPSGSDAAPNSTQTNPASSPVHPVGHSPHIMHQPQHSAPLYPPTSQPTTSGPPAGFRPPGAAYSFPPPPPTSFQSYQPQYPSQNYWRAESSEFSRDVEARKAAAKRETGGAQHYGESVKRHLDIFDLDMNLNEINEGCRRGIDFTQHFGNRAHQTQRTGLSPASMPSIADCEDLINRHQHVLNAMHRLKDLVIAQHNALAEQSRREEASKNHQGGYRDESALYPKESEGGGGFSGTESKRRRGRNAPPGKCHSCNRAETPEWRRGPDGARTLCNACGLHYAKLTRKMGTKAAIGNSSLRPKENTSP